MSNQQMQRQIVRQGPVTTGIFTALLFVFIMVGGVFLLPTRC